MTEQWAATSVSFDQLADAARPCRRGDRVSSAVQRMSPMGPGHTAWVMTFEIDDRSPSHGHGAGRHDQAAVRRSTALARYTAHPDSHVVETGRLLTLHSSTAA